MVDPGVTDIPAPDTAEAVTLLPPGDVPITAVPFEKVGVIVVELPTVIVVAEAVKDNPEGAGTTVTVVLFESVVPAAFVTVKV